jgi:6,7-dimethyl-8-ribityllumazine synthase
LTSAQGPTRVALCVARFYAELADRLLEGARAALSEAGVSELELFEVPGAFELPLAARYAAVSGRFHAVVCLGAVIRGETDHYAYVSAESARGIQQVQLETGVPCGFGLLTVDSMEQALERVRGGTKRDTGRHAVEAALAALAVRRQLERGSP